MECTSIANTAEVLAKVYRKAAHLKAQNVLLSDVISETNLDKLLKLQLANLYQDNEYIIEVIKAETPFFVNRALSYKWFFDNSVEYLNNFDYFEKHLLPNVSQWVRRKLLERLNVHLKDEATCDKYFTAILLRHGIADAIPILPSCSVNLITSVLNEWKVLLSCQQLLLIYNKSRHIAIEYLNTFVFNFCCKANDDKPMKRIGILKTYNKIFKQLLVDDPILFKEIYTRFCTYFGNEFKLFILNNKRMKLNKMATRHFLKAFPQFAIENAEICFELLYLQMLYENLAVDHFTKFCVGCLPSNSDFIKWNKMYLLVGKMKADEKIFFIKNIYEPKYKTDILNDHGFNNSAWVKALPPDVKTMLFKKYSRVIEKIPQSCSIKEVIFLLQNNYDTNEDITYKCVLLDLLRKCVIDKGYESIITKLIFELCAKRDWEIIRDEGQSQVKTRVIDILAQVWSRQILNIARDGKVLFSKKYRWPYNSINQDYIESQFKFFLTNNLPVEAELILCLVYRQMNYYSHNLINANNCRKLDVEVFVTILQIYADRLQKTQIKSKELLLASLTVFVFGKIWHKSDNITLCDYPSIIEHILLNFRGLVKSDSDLLFKWLKKDKKACISLPNMIFELRHAKCCKVDKVYIMEHILNYQPKLLLTLNYYSFTCHYDIMRYCRRWKPNYRNFLTKIMLLHHDTIGNHIIRLFIDAGDEQEALKIQRLTQDRQEYLSYFLEYLQKVNNTNSYRIADGIFPSYSENDLNKLIKNEIFFQIHNNVIHNYCDGTLKTYNGYKTLVDIYDNESRDSKIKDSIIPHIIWHCVRNVVPNYTHYHVIKHFFNYLHKECKKSQTHSKMISLITKISNHSLFTFELELIDIATNYLIEFKQIIMEQKRSVIKYLGLCLHFNNKLYENNIAKLISALVECTLHQCDMCYDNDDFAVHFIGQVVEYIILFSLAVNKNNLYLVLTEIKSNWNTGKTENTELFMYISIWLDILTLYFKSEKELNFSRSNVSGKLVNVWREFGTKCALYFEEQSALHGDDYSEMYRDATRVLVTLLGSQWTPDVDLKLPKDCREAFVKGLTGSMKRDMEFYFNNVY